jgi:hypothetical protein
VPAILTVPTPDEGDEPTWEKCDLFSVLPLDVMDAIEDQIETRCKFEDAERRALASSKN